MYNVSSYAIGHAIIIGTVRGILYTSDTYHLGTKSIAMAFCVIAHLVMKKCTVAFVQARTQEAAKVPQVDIAVPVHLKAQNKSKG